MMKELSRSLLQVCSIAIAILFAAVSMLTTATETLSSEFKVGELKIEEVWSRATPKGAKVGAGYLKITNAGSKPDRLVDAKTSISDRVEIHEMSMSGGIMRMRRLPKGLEIPAGQSATLRPGGYHLMFMELQEAIKKGQLFKATLVFEQAGQVVVEFKASGIGAAAPSRSHSGSHSGAAEDKK